MADDSSVPKASLVAVCLSGLYNAVFSAGLNWALLLLAGVQFSWMLMFVVSALGLDVRAWSISKMAP